MTDWNQNIDPYQPPLAPLERAEKQAVTAQPGELFAAFRLALSRMSGGVLQPFLIFTAVQFLLVVVPNAFWQQFAMGRMAQLGAGNLKALLPVLLGWAGMVSLMVVVSTTVSAAQMGLCLPLRALMVEGRTARVTLKQAIRLSFSNFWHVVGASVVAGLVMAVGTMFCIIPGLVAAFFFQLAPYLAAQGASVSQSLSAAPSMAHRHWAALLTLGALLLGIAVILGVGVFVVQFGLTQAGGVAGGTDVSFQLLYGVVSSVVGLFGWIFWAAAMVYVETTDKGVPLKWREDQEAQQA